MNANVLLYFADSFVPTIYTLKRLNTHWICSDSTLPTSHVISILKHDWSGHFPTHYVLAHSLQWMLWGQLSSKVMALRNFNFWMSFQNSQHDKISDHSSIVRHGRPCIWSMFSRAGLRLKISKSLLICDWCGTNDLQVCSFSKTQTLKAFIFPISPWLLPTYPLPAGKYVTLCIILFCELRAIFVRYALRNF